MNRNKPLNHVESRKDELLPPSWIARSVSGALPSEDMDFGLYTTGGHGAFRSRILSGIRSAKEVVLVASFLLSDEKITEALLALGENVRLYILTASETHLAKLLQDDSHFDQRRIDEHRELLNQLAPRAIVRTAAHFHAKFVVIDPKTSPSGWISTANLNPALIDSVELGVELKAPDALALAGWFNRIFWSEADRELRKAGSLEPVNQSSVVPAKPQESAVVVTTMDEFSLAKNVQRIIEQSTKELLVSSYGLEHNHRVVNALIERVQRGVKLTVFTRPRVAVAQAVSALVAAGATVIAHEKLHAKAIWGDAGAVVMSANLEEHGLDKGFEVGVLLDSKQSVRLRAVLTQWEQSFSWRYSATTRRGQYLGPLLLASEPPKTRSRSVVEKITKPLSSVVADNAHDLDNAARPNFQYTDDAKVLPQSIEFEWMVHAPELPKGATERFYTAKPTATSGGEGAQKLTNIQRSFEPPVYQHNARHYVVLRSLEEIDAAKRLADEFKATIVVMP